MPNKELEPIIKGLRASGAFSEQTLRQEERPVKNAMSLFVGNLRQIEGVRGLEIGFEDPGSGDPSNGHGLIHLVTIVDTNRPKPYDQRTLSEISKAQIAVRTEYPSSPIRYGIGVREGLPDRSDLEIFEFVAPGAKHAVSLSF